MSKYTWVITEDSLPAETSTMLVRAGPAGPEDRPAVSEVIGSGEQFRLLDGYGNEICRGYICGEYSGHEPLEDYGRRYGCTRVEYERNGDWVSP